MDNKSRSFGEMVRNTTKSGGQRIGHGIEGVRSRVGQRSVRRTERSTGQPIEGRDSVPAAGIPGNTSETGATPQPTGTGRSPLPSPLGRPAGCSAPTGAMLITTVSLLGAVIWHRQR